MIRIATRLRGSAPAWHTRFLAMLPAIEAHARVAFRHLTPEAREDAVQETIKTHNSYLAAGKDPDFPVGHELLEPRQVVLLERP